MLWNMYIIKRELYNVLIALCAQLAEYPESK